MAPYCLFFWHFFKLNNSIASYKKHETISLIVFLFEFKLHFLQSIQYNADKNLSFVVFKINKVLFFFTEASRWLKGGAEMFDIYSTYSSNQVSNLYSVKYSCYCSAVLL